MRAAFGEPLAQDYVRIQYLTHASFAIETHGGLVAVTDYTGYVGAGDVVPDVVTMNNAHSTHWTARPDPRIPHLLQGWAVAGEPTLHELDLGEMLVRNVPTDVRSTLATGCARTATRSSSSRWRACASAIWATCITCRRMTNLRPWAGWMW